MGAIWNQQPLHYGEEREKVKMKENWEWNNKIIENGKENGGDGQILSRVVDPWIGKEVADAQYLQKQIIQN